MSDTPDLPDASDVPPPSDPIVPIALQDEMENSFLDYAMSVIMSRALLSPRTTASTCCAIGASTPLCSARSKIDAQDLAPSAT